MQPSYRWHQANRRWILTDVFLNIFFGEFIYFWRVLSVMWGGQRDGVQQWELQSFAQWRNRWEKLARGGWIPVKKKVTAERDRQHVRHIHLPLCLLLTHYSFLPPPPSFQFVSAHNQFSISTHFRHFLSPSLCSFFFVVFRHPGAFCRNAVQRWSAGTTMYWFWPPQHNRATRFPHCKAQGLRFFF